MQTNLAVHKPVFPVKNWEKLTDTQRFNLLQQELQRKQTLNDGECIRSY